MSSALLDARQITRVHGTRTVLDHVDLHVGGDSRIALVGPNGAGKSTLLRILAGIEQPDGGRVRRHGTVGYLPQLASEAEADGARSVRETIMERIGVAPAARTLDRLTAALDEGQLDAIDDHAEAVVRWVTLGGGDADARLETAAAEMGLDGALLDRPLATLSGGQAARAGLAALRTSRFDVVLLDEPTNHLDADGLDRLRALLHERAGGTVVVSHDRALLADVADEVVALDARTGAATHHSGGWESYEQARANDRARQFAAHEDALAQARAAADGGGRGAPPQRRDDEEGRAQTARQRQARRRVVRCARRRRRTPRRRSSPSAPSGSRSPTSRGRSGR